MSNEYRVFGPPGCGKTTYIASTAAENAETFGEDQVSICSLTNTAVREAVGRDLPLPPENVSTLHARCKRSLNAGPPAEAAIAEFFHEYPAMAQEPWFPKNMLQRSAKEDPESVDEVMVGGGREPSVFERMQIARQQMDEGAFRINQPMRELRAAWNDWLTQTHRLDFTGWLEVALEEGSLPAQQVLFVDEAQDHTPLQLAVIRNWQARHRVLVGDDDQNIYEWSGAIPERFYLPEIPSEREKVLSQSYRVPRAVHSVAMRWISQVRQRKVKEYYARDEDGYVDVGGWSLWNAEQGNLPRRLWENPEDTHMFLATTGYMVDKVVAILRSHGISYHNPYRQKATKWNPLNGPGETIEDYLRPSWTWRQAHDWLSVLKSGGVFQSKQRVKLLTWLETERPREVFIDDLAKFLLPETVDRIENEDVRLFEHRRKGLHSGWSTAVDVYHRGETEGLRTPQPKVIVGTVHSVKGGQADHVYLLPDLSFAAHMERIRPQTADRIVRLMYVGMTRARKGLLLGSASERYAVSWN